MANCKDCGTTLRSDLGFCHECGTKVEGKKHRSLGKTKTSFTLGFWVNFLIAFGVVAGVIYLLWRFN